MTESQGVQLRDGQSASNLFHKILWQTKRRFADLGKYANLTEDPKQFRRHYVEQLPQFEAVRLSSADRAAMAGELAQSLLAELVYQDAGASLPLQEFLQQQILEKRVEPATLQTMQGERIDPWKFQLEYEGRHWDSLQALSDLLVSRRIMNSSAGEALTWLQRQVLAVDGLDLHGHKVVVFGAGAEMASARLFLAAGADVLWLDLVAPLAEITADSFSGKLFWPDKPMDLLLEPVKVLSTILEFAGDDAVHLCLYAYAPGQAREIRLTGAMNAIVEALPQDAVRSITMLVSPTTTSELHAQDVLDIEARKSDAPYWEQALGRVGMMGRPGVAGCRYASVTRTLVNIQGTSYQAAQYLGKLMAAEAWHARGIRVSANTAAITQTRSLDHPVFDAAFGGAKALQVETFTPLQSQTINGLLSLHDWLSPDRPPPGRARVHGGIHTLPYPLDKALRIAAAIGFARSPGLLKGLLRR